MTRPRISVSVLIGLAATALMLAANWMLAPQIIGLFSSIERFGPFFFATTPSHLIADLMICFIFTVAFLYAVQLRSAPHGIVIACCMALVGWLVYFTEVGFFNGMLHSEYPFWYEAISFVKYFVALALAVYLRGRAQQGVPADRSNSPDKVELSN
jgi:hypothetical protein